MKKLPLILLILAFGCKTKEYVVSERTKTDSLIIKTETIKAPVISDLLVIPDICDTITNKVTKFRKVFVVNGDSIELLTNEANELKFEIKTLEKDLHTKDSVYRSSLETDKERVKKVKYRTDWRLILGALVVGGLIGFFRPWRLI